MTHIQEAVERYTIKDTLKNSEVYVLILVGELESREMQDSAKMLDQIFPHSCLNIMDDYHSGELSLKHPDI